MIPRWSIQRTRPSSTGLRYRRSMSQQRSPFASPSSIRARTLLKRGQGNTIPASVLSPYSQKVPNTFFPLPNYGSPGAIENNYLANFPIPINSAQGDARVDQLIGSKHLIFARYTYKNRRQKRCLWRRLCKPRRSLRADRRRKFHSRGGSGADHRMELHHKPGTGERAARGLQQERPVFYIWNNRTAIRQCAGLDRFAATSAGGRRHCSANPHRRVRAARASK